jgi:hypothetical protein
MATNITKRKIHREITQNETEIKKCIQGVSAKTFEPNISIIFQQIFAKLRNADILDGEE